MRRTALVLFVSMVLLSAAAWAGDNAVSVARTGSEAKRLCAQGGVSVDGAKATDPNAEVTPREGMVIQVGKRRFAKLKLA